jgi:hypothetical protein
MSMKLQFACLSLGAAVDQQTGNLSVFDVLDEIRVPQVPAHIPSLMISIMLQKKDDSAFDGKILIHLLTPDGKQAVLGNGDLHVPAEQHRVKAVFRFGGFPLYTFGAHRLVISWVDSAGKKIGEALLDFEAVQAAQVAQAMGSQSSPGPGEKPPLSH